MTEPTGGAHVDPTRGGGPLDGMSWDLSGSEEPYRPEVPAPAAPDAARARLPESPPGDVPAEPAPTAEGAATAALPAVGRQDLPAEPVASMWDGGSDQPPAPPEKPWWKRPLFWVLAAAVILIGVLVALIVGNRSDSEPVLTPAASTVTLAPPTPTIEPSPRPEGATAFLVAQPGTVLSYALVSAERDEQATSGALESWHLEYSDGSSGDPITVYAEQYPDAASAQAAIEFYLDPAVAAAATPAPSEAPAAEPSATPSGGASASATASSSAESSSGSTDDASAAPTAGAEYGSVMVAGAEAGTYYWVPNEDGSESVFWANGTALFVAQGPAGVMKDFFLAYPL